MSVGEQQVIPAVQDSSQVQILPAYNMCSKNRQEPQGLIDSCISVVNKNSPHGYDTDDVEI